MQNVKMIKYKVKHTLTVTRRSWGKKAIITRSQLSYFLTKCFVFFLLYNLIKHRYSDLLYIKCFWKNLLLLIKFFFFSYSGKTPYS